MPAFSPQRIQDAYLIMQNKALQLRIKIEEVLRLQSDTHSPNGAVSLETKDVMDVMPLIAQTTLEVIGLAGE